MARLQNRAWLGDGLEQLRQEHARVERAIRALTAKLERLAPSEAGVLLPRARSRDGWTQAKRQQVSQRMRDFWAARRRAAHEGDAGMRPQ